MTKQRFTTGMLALMVGCLVNYVGDRLIGVRLELFWGLNTFNLLWFLELFILPVFVGISVSMVFGLGGKWLCYFPPLIVRCISYYEMKYLLEMPSGASLMPFGWYVFYVILAVESAAIGGVLGEVMIKRIYGRTDPEVAKRELIQPEKKDHASNGE
jgi:hypothetical protein